MSACIITLNEARRLPRCLKSLPFADEIVILDSGSVDHTREIARKAGALVFERKFTGFVEQKNALVRKARGDWILVIDADEVVTPGLASEIEKVIESSHPNSAFRIPRMSYYLGRWIRFSGWYPDYNIRLFKKGSGSFQGGTVHEEYVARGSIGTLKNHLEHYSYENISHHLLRIDQYSTLIAQDKYKRGEHSTIIWAIIKSISKFLLTYIYRGGFMDGRAGLVIAVMGGYYNFLKYVKLWELGRGYRVPGSLEPGKVKD